MKETRDQPDERGERALARLWRNAHARSDGLLVEDGRRFRVVYPGRPSGGAGPDFRDAVLKSDSGRFVTGDVELHVAAADWRRHGHHRDPGYNGVILHVVLHERGGATSVQQSGATPPLASIGPVAERLGRAESFRPSVGPLARCTAKSDLEEVLDRAGDQRFYAKSRGFALELESAHPDEALYDALIEAMGYSSNRKPFRELAKAVPFSQLKKMAGEPAATRLLAITAMLVNAAGLVDYVQPREEARRIKGVLRLLPKTGKVALDGWRTTRMRPANHPARRVAAAAHIVDSHVLSGLVQGLEELVRTGTHHALVRRLTARPYLGQGRTKAIAVNAVLPFLHAWAGMRREPALGELCLQMYRGFPVLEDNEITREMRRVLSIQERGVRIAGARRHQGLIYLYRSMTGRVFS